MRYLYFLVIAIFLVACSGSDGVEIQSASLKGVKASINEDVAVGSTLSGTLYIENAPYNLADVLIAISGEGSEDFSVKVSSGATTDTFVGTITLIHSLLGKGGTKYSLTATATLDGHSISAPVDISILEVDTRAPDISANPKRQVSWGDDYVLTPTNSGGVATYHIKNKPSWATFDTTTGILSGTPTLSDLGVTSDINITAVNDEGSSFLNLFNIEVTKRTPPNIGSGEAKNLNLNVFNFPFNDEPLWREHITKVSFIRGYGESEIVLGSGDYTISAGNFALKVKDSDKVALHSAFEGGCEVKFKADGYLDNSILIGIVGSGTNAVKLQITSQTPLIETNLDNAKVNITLLNQLKFADSSLDKSKFTLLGTPTGVSILGVNYISDTSALLTLSFNGSDFDENKMLSLSIAPDELNVDQSLYSNRVQIKAVVEEEPTLIVPNFLSSLPADDSANIAVDSKIEFSLDQDMSDALLELSSCTLTNMDSYASVDFSLSYMGKKLILTPSSNLKYNHPYIVQCSISDGSTTKSSEDISFDTKELFIPIMKTGITKSYDKKGLEDPNIKDDGHYQKGKSIHRSREGNITTDYVTGLMWNDNAFYETRTVTSAKMYCRTLKAGGYIDWRLPTAKELQSLMIYDGTEAKDIDHFKHLTHVGRYWSSTKTIESSSYNGDAYIEVRFPSFVADELETKGNHVLCVRKR